VNFENKNYLFILVLIVFIGVNQISIWGLQKQTQNNNHTIQSQSDLIYNLTKEVNILKKETDLERLFKGIKVRKPEDDKRGLIIK